MWAASLAGIPIQVVERARVILETLENDHVDKNGLPKVPPRRTTGKSDKQLNLFHVVEHPLIDKLREMTLEHMSPLEALEALHRMREELKA